MKTVILFFQIMTSQQTKTEWKKLFHKIHHNKPKTKGPWPAKVVWRRELLLFAEVALAKIEAGEKKDFYTDFYKTTMRHYYKK